MSVTVRYLICVKRESSNFFQATFVNWKILNSLVDAVLLLRESALDLRLSSFCRKHPTQEANDRDRSMTFLTCLKRGNSWGRNSLEKRCKIEWYLTPQYCTTNLHIGEIVLLKASGHGVAAAKAIELWTQMCSYVYIHTVQSGGKQSCHGIPPGKVLWARTAAKLSRPKRDWACGIRLCHAQWVHKD